MRQRTVGLVFPVLAAGLVLGAVWLLAYMPAQAGEGQGAVDGAEGTVPIAVWHTFTGDRAQTFLSLIDEFNAVNAHEITVAATFAGSYGETYDRVISGLQSSGPLPNAVIGYPQHFADYARYGAVRFLDGYVADPQTGVDLDDFYSGLVDNYRLDQYGNQLAGLQFGQSIEVMYYNADLLSAVAVTVPTTWEEFEAACMAVATGTVSGTVPGTDASRFATWLWSHGGDLLSIDGKKAAFQAQPGIDSLQVFRRLFDGGYGRPIGGAYEEYGLFGAGQLAFVFASSAGMPYLRQGMEGGAGQTWGVARGPAVAGNEVVDVYGGGMGLLRENEEKDRAAWLFLRWLTEPEQTARWAARSGYYPVRLSAVNHPSMTQKLADDPQYAQGHALLPLGRAEPGLRDYEAVRRTLGAAVEQVLNQGANVTDTLQAAALEVDTLLDQTGPQSQVVSPEGATLAYTNTDGVSATVEFPVGSVEVTETVSYVPLSDLPAEGLAFALVPNMTFSQPVTVTLQYRDEDVVGMDEALLRLYQFDWESGSWRTADPCGGYYRDVENNILQAGVCHFSDYGLRDFGYRVYLPLVLGGL